MPSTKDITIASSNILLIGDTGSHKTFFLGTVPGIHILDFDKGLAILRHRDVQYDTFKEKPRGEKVQPFEAKLGIYEFGQAWPAFIKRVNEIGQAIDKGQGPKALGLDSLTFMSQIAENKILLDNGHATLTLPDHGALQSYLKTVIGQLTAWPIQLICTAHIQRSDNDITQVQEKLPLVYGKLAGLLPAYFDEVYFCESETGPDGKQKFTVKTKATPSMRQAKSRMGVPDGTLTDYAAIMPFFNLKPAA